MPETKKSITKQVLPLLALRGLTIFPYMSMHFDVGRSKSLKAIEDAMENNQLIFLIPQKDTKIDDPQIDDLYEVGTISKVKQLIKLPGGTVRVLIEGLSRARISKVVKQDPLFVVETEEQKIIEDEDLEIEALMRKLKESFEEYVKMDNKANPEVVLNIVSSDNISEITDMIASNLSIKIEEKQRLLEEFDPKQRVYMLLRLLSKEVEVLQIEKDINSKVKQQIDKTQREYYLREQLKVIQDELGDKDGIKGEVNDYKQRLKDMNLPEEVEEKATKEADRLLKIPQGSAEGSVVRTYLDWILSLPWNKSSKEKKDLKRARKILERDHYGLEKVKDRIIEYLAIRLLSNSLKGPILCLVGPPGVGKTSIAHSIAECLNRKYVRMSLGGVRDEAEIRGHRKTYVGSMPGRIIKAMNQAGTKNPLVLLDEIDKMSSDFKGDPTSAMLEVLDSEQNHSFKDHYLEVPFDLSNVLFLTTANNMETIPRPLLDRMEIIHISGYTEEEKLNIAQRHLIPKQVKEHGLKKSNIKLDEQTVRDIINYYTREAGVRSLEREIGSVCRKVATDIVSNDKKSVKVSSQRLEKFLGTKKYRYDKANEKNEIGIAKGLAWTSVGGDTLSIEVTIMSGSGKLELTGHLGDIMKESARAGVSYIRSIAEQLGIDRDFYKNVDIHIHIPEGAIPKDGPSAGITMTTAMISALTELPVKRDVAMTGEITLRGRVLPVGGIKEKVLAANRAGITTVILPAENKKDLDEVPENVKQNINFVFTENIETVLETALVKYKTQLKSKITSKSKKDESKKSILSIIKNQNNTEDSATIQ